MKNVWETWTVKRRRVSSMNDKKYLKWYHKVAYGSGDIASNCGYALISSFMMLYLTNAVGLNSAVIGTLMMLSKLLDGVSDIY